MDFNLVHVDDTVNPVMVVTADSFEEALGLADTYLLDVVDTDEVSRSLVVDAFVGECDACGQRQFLVTKDEVKLGDGTVDDVFRFCVDCTSASHRG
jgi:hypothetical protein